MCLLLGLLLFVLLLLEMGGALLLSVLFDLVGLLHGVLLKLLARRHVGKGLRLLAEPVPVAVAGGFEHLVDAVVRPGS